MKDQNKKEYSKESQNKESSTRKIKGIRNLKISLTTMKFMAPYVLTFGIAAGALKIGADAWPIYRDNQKNYYYVNKEFDNLGNTEYHKQLEPFTDSEDVLRHDTRLCHQNDGTYVKNIELYDLKGKSPDEVTELLKDENLHLEEELGTPKFRVPAVYQNPTNQELAAKDYLQANIFYQDKNQYTIAKESSNRNMMTTLCWFLCSTILSIQYYLSYGYKYKDKLASIKKEYETNDAKSSNKKLEKKSRNR